MIAMDAASYSDAAVLLDELWLRVQNARRRRGLSLREAAGQIGIGHSTLARLEYTGVCSLPNAVQVLRWLGSL
jgi:ribosome-binding protein aMBF1 (putative translation factor)